MRKNEILAMSRIYVNKSDQLYKNLKHVQEIDGYEDFGIHGTSEFVEYETTGGKFTSYTAKEYAEILRSDPEYHNGNIRLLSCNVGATENGFAQQLADELGVEVLAPTETLWTNEKGDCFISNSDVVADLWYAKENVQPTGEWKRFMPRRKKND